MRAYKLTIYGKGDQSQQSKISKKKSLKNKPDSKCRIKYKPRWTSPQWTRHIGNYLHISEHESFDLIFFFKEFHIEYSIDISCHTNSQYYSRLSIKLSHFYYYLLENFMTNLLWLSLFNFIEYIFKVIHHDFYLLQSVIHFDFMTNFVHYRVLDE